MNKKEIKKFIKTNVKSKICFYKLFHDYIGEIGTSFTWRNKDFFYLDRFYFGPGPDDIKKIQKAVKKSNRAVQEIIEKEECITRVEE